MSDNSFIACQSGGYYGDACIRKGWINSGQCFVIDWRMFQKFMNGGIATRPIFISDSYKVCMDMAKQLNDTASEIQMEKYIQDTKEEVR